MFANDIAFANRLDWNFAMRFSSCFQNLSQRFGRPAWRIFFHLVMRFDNRDVKIAAEPPGSFARQPEKHVDSDAEIRRKHDWQRLRARFNYSALLLRMTGRSNNQRLAMLQRSRADFTDSVGVAEIDRHIAISHGRFDRIAKIALPD